jgi:hypothetical protein
MRKCVRIQDRRPPFRRQPIVVDTPQVPQDSWRTRVRGDRVHGVMKVRMRRIHGRPFLLAVLALAFGLVSGCSALGGDQTPQDNGNTPPAATTSASSDADNGDGSNGNGSEDDDSVEGLAWVPFGPKDPTNPTPTWPTYNSFAEGKCAQLRDYLGNEGAGIAASDLAKAMVAVCAAAIEGQEDQWKVAEAHADPDLSGIQDSCLGSAVKELLDRALAWHQKYPGQTPEVQFQTVEGRTECGERYPPDEQPPSEEPSPTEAPPTPEASPSEPPPSPDETPAPTDEPTDGSE